MPGSPTVHIQIQQELQPSQPYKRTVQTRPNGRVVPYPPVRPTGPTEPVGPVQQFQWPRSYQQSADGRRHVGGSLHRLFAVIITLFIVLNVSAAVVVTVQTGRLAGSTHGIHTLCRRCNTPHKSVLTTSKSIVTGSSPSGSSFSCRHSCSTNRLCTPIAKFFSVDRHN